MPDHTQVGPRLRVLVTGSRTWTRARDITTALDALHTQHGDRLIVVHGACPRGADAIADAWCRRHGVAVERHPAAWSTGPAAGPARNAAMVATSPDLCVAFIRDNSPGATGCAHLAETAGIPTTRHIHTNPRTALLTAALDYAARSWHVFPLWPGSKAPAVPDAWQRRATCDPDLIHRWWAARPFNIGLAVGPSRLVVVDLDPAKPGRHGCGGGAATSATTATSQVNPVASCRGTTRASATSATSHQPAHGRDVFADLCHRHGQPIPANTYTVATPSGGWHLYYQHPTGPVLRNTKGGTGRALGHNIDTRGHGGYVVAPGSLINGRPYTVVRDLPLAPLPGWLTTLLHNLDTAATTPPTRPATPTPAPLGADRRSAYLRAALDREAGHVHTAPKGRRNAALWGAAVALGQLVAGGELDATTVTTVLEQAGNSAGLPAGEVRPTIRSGLRRGAQHPRTVT
jgi:hypothetical protein